MELNIEQKKQRAKKTMLWITMASIVMIFAGLTSAYIASSSRKDWLNDLEIPSAFFISTIVIILSSLTFHIAKKSLLKNDHRKTMLLLLSTLVLGIIFVVLQFQGFSQFIEAGYFFTGAQSSITTSFIYIIVVTHLAHLFGGLIAILIIIYNHYKKRYNSNKYIGLELGTMLWHFLGLLWIYLVLFFHFSS